MFARVTGLQISPDRLDQAAQAVRDEGLPALREIQGFRGIIQLADRSSGDVLVVGLWENEQALKGSEDAVDRIRSQVAERIGSQVQSVKEYEVTAFEV